MYSNTKINLSWLPLMSGLGCSRTWSPRMRRKRGGWHRAQSCTGKKPVHSGPHGNKPVEASRGRNLFGQWQVRSGPHGIKPVEASRGRGGEARVWRPQRDSVLRASGITPKSNQSYCAVRRQHRHCRSAKVSPSRCGMSPKGCRGVLHNGKLGVK